MMKISNKTLKTLEFDKIRNILATLAPTAGAAALAVHGRTRQQYYSGKADWDIIKLIVEDNFALPMHGASI